MDEEQRMKRIIWSAVFLIWFFGSLFAMIYFSSIHSILSIIMFGQYFLVFGLGAAYKKVGIICLPFILVGLGCIVIPIGIKYEYLFSHSINWIKIIFFCMTMMFIIIPTIILLFFKNNYKKQKKRCTILVKGKVIRIEKNGKLFTPIYKYNIGSEELEYTSIISGNYNVPKIGSIKNIYINPDDYSDAVEESKISIIVYIFYAIIVIVGILSSILVLLKDFN